ncbi:hypothetical protein PUN4_10180 [Paraburkholderia unamae]|nr:hypothetical protein PUN4_10180 [Paraburkholderia unamae]
MWDTVLSLAIGSQSQAMLARRRTARIVHSDALRWPVHAPEKQSCRASRPMVRTRVRPVQGIVLLDVFALRRLP